MTTEQQYSLGIILPPPTITFMTDNGTTEVMKINNEGVWVNPSLTVDEAASAVIKALVKRQPLSDEAIKAVYYSQLKKYGQLCDMDDIEFFARSIEAAHGITNEP